MPGYIYLDRAPDLIQYFMENTVDAYYSYESCSGFTFWESLDFDDDGNSWIIPDSCGMISSPSFCQFANYDAGNMESDELPDSKIYIYLDRENFTLGFNTPKEWGAIGYIDTTEIPDYYLERLCEFFNEFTQGNPAPLDYTDFTISLYNGYYGTYAWSC